MANAAGLIKESIWRDKDFRQLPRTAQCTYAQLVSQKELDRAGMQPLQVAKWAKACEELSEAAIRSDLAVLEERRFVFVDDDTDEVFIRSYMRHAEVARYPNILKNALRCARMVASDKLRYELATELRKLHKADASTVADEIQPTDYTPPDANGSETKSNGSRTVPETVPEGLNGSETLREPQGYGYGSRYGSSSVAGHLGGARARDDEPEPPEPNQLSDEPPRYCSRHMPNGTAEPCGSCRAARERHAAWEEHQTHIDALRRADRQREIAECPHCDEAGWALDDTGAPIEPAIHCTHEEHAHA